MIGRIVREDLAKVAQTISPQVKELVSTDLVLTGATGFVGKWLVGAWLHGANEFGGDGRLLLSSRNPEKIFETYPEIQTNSRVSLQAVDIRKLEIPSDFSGCNVIHGATAASEHLNVNAPFEMIDVIVQGTRRVVDECGRVGTRKLVFLSSGAVYGFGKVGCLPFSELDISGPSTTDSRNAYHEAKRLAELLVTIGGERYGFQELSLRLFTFVGPYLPLDRHFAVGMFIREALTERRVRIRSGGGSVRSYQYGADMARDIIFCTSRDMKHTTYNVGSPQPISIAQLAHSVASAAGDDISVEISGMDTAETTSAYVPDTSRIMAESTYSESVDLVEALERTILATREVL